VSNLNGFNPEVILLILSSLDGIVEALDPYEWRRMRKLLQKRNFQFDVIGSRRMPVELVMHIFSYLEVTDVFRNQRVC
jgi:hypothetical protein